MRLGSPCYNAAHSDFNRLTMLFPTPASRTEDVMNKSNAWAPKRGKRNPRRLRSFADSMDALAAVFNTNRLRNVQDFRIAAHLVSMEIRKLLWSPNTLATAVESPRLHPLFRSRFLEGDLYETGWYNFGVSYTMRKVARVKFQDAEGNDVGEYNPIISTPEFKMSLGTYDFRLYIHPLHGFTYDSSVGWRLNRFIDEQEQPVKLDKWLSQNLFGVERDERLAYGRNEYTLRRTLTWLANKEALHTDVPEKKEEYQEYRDMEIVNVGTLHYPHIVMLQVARYLLRQYHAGWYSNRNAWESALPGRSPLQSPVDMDWGIIASGHAGVNPLGETLDEGGRYRPIGVTTLADILVPGNRPSDISKCYKVRRDVSDTLRSDWHNLLVTGFLSSDVLMDIWMPRNTFDEVHVFPL